MRRAAVFALVLLALLAPAGCAKKGDQLGAGEDVGFCPGWLLFDRLDEPVIDDRDAVLRWADGELRIVDRIDLRFKVIVNRRAVPPPDEVRQRLEVVKHQLEAFRDRVRAAGGADAPEEVRRAVSDLARTDFDGAADELTRARGRLCPS
jgi:hypothetical protein